jgi:hypothetical protein
MNVHYLHDHSKMTTQEDNDDSDAHTDQILPLSRQIKKEGVVPKDLESKKEIMSFIAYANNLEQTCKLLTFNKQVGLAENDTNRLYLSGTSIMSIKLPVSKAYCNDLCCQLEDQQLHKAMVRKSNFLDKANHTKCLSKLKGWLTTVTDLQSKYVELPDFKKVSCFNIDKCMPEVEVEDSDQMSEAKLEQIKLNRRKRRKLKNSFINKYNLV